MFRKRNTKIVIGNFNSHNAMWGFIKINEDDEKAEDWADRKYMNLIRDAKLSLSFNSSR